MGVSRVQSKNLEKGIDYDIKITTIFSQEESCWEINT